MAAVSANAGVVAGRCRGEMGGGLAIQSDEQEGSVHQSRTVWHQEERRGNRQLCLTGRFVAGVQRRRSGGRSNRGIRGGGQSPPEEREREKGGGECTTRHHRKTKTDKPDTRRSTRHITRTQADKPARRSTRSRRVDSPHACTFPIGQPLLYLFFPLRATGSGEKIRLFIYLWIASLTVCICRCYLVPKFSGCRRPFCCLFLHFPGLPA